MDDIGHTKRKSDMLHLQRDCSSHKLTYLKSALDFLQRFSEQTLSDKEKLEELVKAHEKQNEKIKSMSNSAREDYGKIFVFSKPHDSDVSEDEFDSDIYASSSIADNEYVTADEDDMNVDGN